MKYKTFILLPSFQTNTYLLWEEKTREAMLIDPADGSDDVSDYIMNSKLKLKYIINTHGHGDHIGGNVFFKRKFPAAKLAIHKEDKVMLTKSDLNLSLYYEQETISTEPDILLENGDLIILGDRQVKVLHTPGHTKGGISLLSDDLLFSGDTLFLEDIGRTDLPGGSYTQLIASINDQLMILPEKTKVLPGHGDSSTIEHEKQYNPYVGK